MRIKTLIEQLRDRLTGGRRLLRNKLDFREAYSLHVRSLERDHNRDRAMQLAVGGEFDAIGLLELEVLKHFGLKPESYVIDVGCGSGRLAKPLSSYLRGSYLGIDVVPELIDHARTLVARPDWQFDLAEGLSIPEQCERADFVCFFSVFTHLLHEQSYSYLAEAARVLKRNGRIVFTFLDFLMRDHWAVFEASIADLNRNARPLNVFMSKDAIGVWAGHLGLRVVTIEDGDQPFVPLSTPITFESGRTMDTFGAVGQSLCVLEKV